MTIQEHFTEITRFFLTKQWSTIFMVSERGVTYGTSFLREWKIMPLHAAIAQNTHETYIYILTQE